MELARLEYARQADRDADRSWRTRDGPAVDARGGSTQECTSFNGGVQHCTGGPSPLHQILSIALFAFLVVGPICTSVYLARRAG
jgi:hypothetical protein